MQRRIPYEKRKKRALYLKKRPGIIKLSYLGEVIPEDILSKVEQKRKALLKNRPKNLLKKSTHKALDADALVKRLFLKIPLENTKPLPPEEKTPEVQNYNDRKNNNTHFYQHKPYNSYYQHKQYNSYYQYKPYNPNYHYKQYNSYYQYKPYNPNYQYKPYNPNYQYKPYNPNYQYKQYNSYYQHNGYRINNN